MANFEKEVQFSSEKNSIEALYDDEFISIVSIDLFHEDKKGESNRNKFNLSHESILASMETIKNKPIIFRLSKLATDVTEHSRNSSEEKEMRVGGIIPNDAQIEFIERPNGKTYLNAQAIIYKNYNPQLMQILKNNNGKMDVSVEIRCAGKQEKETGIFYVSKFSLDAVCVLSPLVEPGIEGSNIEVIKFTKKETTSMNERYAQFARQKNDGEKDVFFQIKNKQKEEQHLENEIGINELHNLMWTAVKKDHSENSSYCWIAEIFPIEKQVILEYDDDGKLFKMDYEISEDKVITINYETKVEVVRDVDYVEIEEETDENKTSYFALSKDEYGKGKKIEIDGSKEALSETAWGKVNKTTLRAKCLNAENYKAVVDFIYLIVEDGWEEAPSSKLKYPVGEIKAGKAVYNRYGLASALGYAKKNNEEAIVKKIESLYKKLEIETDEEKAVREEKEKMSAQYAEKCAEVEKAIAEKEKMEKEFAEKFSAKEQELETLKTENESLKTQNVDFSAKLEKYILRDEIKFSREHLEKYQKVLNKTDIKEIDEIINKAENGEIAITFSEIKEKINEKVLTATAKFVAIETDQSPANRDTKGFMFNFTGGSDEPFVGKSKDIYDVSKKFAKK